MHALGREIDVALRRSAFLVQVIAVEHPAFACILTTLQIADPNPSPLFYPRDHEGQY